MSLTDYQLYVNIAHKGLDPYVLRTLQFRLEGFHIRTRESGRTLENRILMAVEIQDKMAKNKMNQVPANQPYFVGINIISPYGHQCNTQHLVDQIMRAMQGVVFEDTKWCDGISVIRSKEGMVDDCMINIAWKEDPPEKVASDHPLFGEN